jgi:hypothetical protein
MKILSQSQVNRSESDGGHFPVKWIRAHLSQIIESFWFTLAFLLFLLLGPFSAFAVLIGLGSLADEESRARMTEPARL